jgi:hypothetical protein
MNKLPLEPNLTFQQKIHIAIFIFFGLAIITALLGTTVDASKLLFLALAVLVTSFFIVVFFSKNGLVHEGDKIYTGVFIGQILLLKNRINLTDKRACSILKFRKSQKYSFFTAARPDLAHEFNAFDIYLLNDRHTKKSRILSLKKESNSKIAVQFLVDNTHLKHEVYSPNFK